MATRVICMSIHLFVCESVTATANDQVLFNRGLYDTFKVLHSVTLANIKAGFWVGDLLSLYQIYSHAQVSPQDPKAILY